MGVNVVVIALIAGAAYLWSVHGQDARIAEREARAVAAEQRLVAAQRSHSDELERRRDEAVAQSRLVSLLQARRHLAIAVDQLDQRNFGVAGEHWRHAAGDLDRIADREEAVETLRAQLADYSLGEAANFDDTRQELRGFARVLDGFIERAPPPVGPSASAPTLTASGDTELD
ncbi:MAG: hypothetical protein AB7S26_33085 [Sandaracinaceae bacterium]